MAKIVAIKVELSGIAGIITDSKSLKAAIKQTNEELSKTRFGSAEYKKLNSQLAVLKNTQGQVRQATRDAGREHVIAADKGKTSYRAMNAQLVLMRKRFKELSQAERKGKLGSSLLKNIRGLDKELKSIDASIGGFQRNVGNYKQSLLGVGNIVTGGLLTGGIQVAGQAFVSVIKDAANVVKDFDQASADLASVLGKERKDIEALTRDAQRLGATTAFTATQVLKLQTELAKLGFSDTEILASTKAVEDFSIAVGTDAASAAQLAGGTLRAFKIDAKDTERVASTLAVATTKSALDFQKLNDSLSTVGPIARLAGASLERTTSLLGVLSDNNVKASTSGVALRKIFFELSKQGITFEDAMDRIRNSTDKTKTALDLFGDRAALSAVLLSENAEAAAKMEAEITNADEALKKMVEQRLDTVAGQLTLLRSAWEGFILSIEDGEGVISGAFKGVIGQLSDTLELFRRINEGDLGPGEFFKQFSLLGAITGDMFTLNDVLEDLNEKDEQKRANQNELIRQNEILATQLRERGADLATISTITKLSIDELERLFKATKEIAEGTSEEPAVIQSIDFLNDKIKELRETQGKSAIGSATFIQAKKDIARLSKIVKDALAADTDAIAEESVIALSKIVKDLKAEIQLATPEDSETLIGKLVGAEVDLAKAETAIAKLKAIAEGKGGATRAVPTTFLDVDGVEKSIALESAPLDVSDEGARDAIGRRIEAQAEADTLIALQTIDNEKELQAKLAEIKRDATIKNLEFQLTAEGLSNKEELELEIELQEQRNETAAAAAKERQEIETQAINAIQSVLSIISQVSRSRTDAEIAQIEDKYDREIEAAEGNEARISELEAEKAEKTAALQEEQFEREKRLSTIQAIIAGAVAIVQSFAQLGPIAGAIAALAIAATTIAQVATIQNQQFTAAQGALIDTDGGVVHMGGFAQGKSHKQGGIKFGNMEIEGGEFVDRDEFGNTAIINKKNSGTFAGTLKRMAGKRFPGKSAMLSGINSYNGNGIPFSRMGADLVPSPRALASFGSTGTTIGLDSALIAGAVESGAASGVYSGMAAKANAEAKQKYRSERLQKRLGEI